jgi:hypothetical protein
LAIGFLNVWKLNFSLDLVAEAVIWIWNGEVFKFPRRSFGPQMEEKGSSIPSKERFGKKLIYQRYTILKTATPETSLAKEYRKEAHRRFRTVLEQAR